MTAGTTAGSIACYQVTHRSSPGYSRTSRPAVTVTSVIGISGVMPALKPVTSVTC